MTIDQLLAELEAMLAARMERKMGDYKVVPAVDYEALQAECEKLRNGLKNARYRIEQGRIWNGMGWSLTGLHAHQQQRALDEIDAAIQGDKS